MLETSDEVYCPNCGTLVDPTLTTEIPNTGSQLKLVFRCFSGCGVSWAAQPEQAATRGVGNLLITSATDMSGLPFAKLKR